MDKREENLVAFTVVTRNYLHSAAALFESLDEVAPGIRLMVYLADHFPEGFEHSPAVEDLLATRSAQFQIISAEQLGIERWNELTLKYTPFELSCALKPFAGRHVLNTFGDKVVYCDSDLEFHGSLTEVANQLDHCSVLLTPHTLNPATSGSTPEAASRESFNAIARSGVFNAGFFGVRDTQEGQNFLDWWSERCWKDCVVDPSAGIFVDQSWLNFAPTLFNNVHIERRPIYNVAYWNLVDRQLKYSPDGKWVVGDDSHPICFFHFSGFDYNRSDVLTAHHRMVDFDDSEYRQLCDGYAARVARFSPLKYSSLGCEYESFCSGTTISPLWREAVRCGFVELSESEATAPWSVLGSQTLIEELKAAESSALMKRLPWHLAELDRLSFQWQSRILELEKECKTPSRPSRWAEALGWRSAG